MKRKPKPASPAREFERRVTALPPMHETERQEAIRQIAQELGISEKDRERSYAGI